MEEISIHQIKVSEEKDGKNKEVIFQEIQAEIFPEWIEDIRFRRHKSQGRYIKKKSTSRHII